MSNFFESDIIIEELNEIKKLQDDVYEDILEFSTKSVKEKIDKLKKMEELIEKQNIMYMRLSLSNDPRAIQLKEYIQQSFSFFGYSSNTEMNSLFKSLKHTIHSLINYLEKYA